MEWFGKRGISWHISHSVRRTSSNECEVSVYSHLFRKSISQNSEVVAAVMRHILQEEKATSENLSSQLENKLFSLRLTEDLSVTTDRQVLQKG